MSDTYVVKIVFADVENNRYDLVSVEIGFKTDDMLLRAQEIKNLADSLLFRHIHVVVDELTENEENSEVVEEENAH
jgi:hypothetical protein